MKSILYLELFRKSMKTHLAGFKTFQIARSTEYKRTVTKSFDLVAVRRVNDLRVYSQLIHCVKGVQFHQAKDSSGIEPRLKIKRTKY